MALRTADRVKETTTTEGTGTITLLGALIGYQAFSDALADTDTCYYCIEAGADWEVGTGTYNSDTLERTTVQASSNANALVDFPVGTKSVFVTFPARAAKNLPLAPITGIVYVDQNSEAVSPDGSVASPYLTITDALDSIGPATTADEQDTPWRVVIAAGFYDESLTIPSLRSIAFDCEPVVVLSNHSVSSARMIRVGSTTASLSAFNNLTLNLENLIMVHGIRFTQSLAGNISYEFTARNLTFLDTGIPGPQGPSIDARNWSNDALRLNFYDCLIRPIDNPYCIDGGVGKDVAIKRAERCEFDGNIRMAGYGQISLCRFLGDLTFDNPGGAHNVSEVSRPEGFYLCNFGPATNFTGTQAGDFLADSVTWNSATIDLTVNAPSTPTGLSDAFYDSTLSGNFDPGNVTTETSEALNRIASAVAGLLGGNIP